VVSDHHAFPVWTGLRWLAPLLAMLPAACGEIPLRDSEQDLRADLQPRLEQAVASIEPGRSDRAAVRAALGSPWLSSEILGVDAFRLDAKTYAPSLLVVAVPYPVPVPVPKWESGSGFVLVTYDTDGLVEGVAHGLDEAQPAGPSQALPAPRVTDVVRTDGVAVAYLSMNPATKGLPVVTVDPERRRRLTAPADALSCRVLIGCFECDPLLLYLPVGLLLDGYPPLTDRQQVTPIRLEPGKHEFFLPAKGQDEEAKAVFDCTAGQVLYATFLPTTTHRTWHLARTRWTVSIATGLDAPHDAAPLVLDESGAWAYWMLRLSRTNIPAPP